jgi:hypothetical protein
MTKIECISLLTHTHTHTHTHKYSTLAKGLKVKLEVPCLPEKMSQDGVVFAPEYKHDMIMFTAKVPAYALIEMSSFLNGGQWPESKCVIKGRLKSDSMHMNLKVCLCVTLAHRERYVEAARE